MKRLYLAIGAISLLVVVVGISIHYMNWGPKPSRLEVVEDICSADPRLAICYKEVKVSDIELFPLNALIAPTGTYAVRVGLSNIGNSHYQSVDFGGNIRLPGDQIRLSPNEKIQRFKRAEGPFGEGEYIIIIGNKERTLRVQALQSSNRGVVPPDPKFLSKSEGLEELGKPGGALTFVVSTPPGSFNTYVEKDFMTHLINSPYAANRTGWS